jgi:hypothetical protein
MKKSPPLATRFVAGTPSANPSGRPTKLSIALRGLQPLRDIGLTDADLHVLARADVEGSALCREILVAVMAGRVNSAVREP